MTARQSGLGRGLSSLIPRKKTQAAADANYFGSQASDDSVESNDSSVAVQEPKKSIQDQKISDIALRSIMEISVDNISSNPHQPRQKFDEQKLEELASSIKKHGIIQPIVVSRLANGSYELVAGERRRE